MTTTIPAKDLTGAPWLRAAVATGMAHVVALAGTSVLWGAQAPQTPADDTPARVSGIWKLNKDLEKPGDPVLPETPASTGGRTGGGYGGGRGGRGGGGGRTHGGGRNSGNQPEMLQMRALMRETTEAPTQLVIVATAASVTLTDEEGHVRKFLANDKKQKLDIGTAEVDAKARWDAGAFTTEMSLGSLKVTTTYQVTVEGHQLVVTSQTKGGGRSGSTPAVPIKHTYDKAE